MHARLAVMAALVLGFCDGRGPAAEPGRKPACADVKSAAAKTPQQEFQQLREEINEANRRFLETQMQAAAPRLFALMDANPKGDLARDILRFLLYNRQSEGAAFKQKAWRWLAEHYAADEKVGDFLAAAVYYPQGGRQLLERVVAVNPNRALQAQALLGLGEVALHAVDKTPEPDKQKPLLREAEALFQRVVHQYANVAVGEVKGKPSLAGERAEGFLREMHLSVGQPFPDLEGLSVAGAREHVAAYRGKVVVFDVWATWCGPCNAMIPHEREMVEKLKGQPFALISVSADDEKSVLEKFLEKTPMPWVHWWGKADAGKLLKALNIRFYPTIYVLDANGVIRYKNVRGEELTKAVEVCLAELKKAEKPK